jgi:hypothetical protein
LSDYFTVTATPLHTVGGIQIEAVTKNVSPGDITAIKVKRRVTGTTAWTEIWSKDIALAADFSFNIIDYGAKSHYPYQYGIFPYAGEVAGTEDTVTATCEFDGIFISDSTATYIGMLNVSYTPPTKNNDKVYITPLTGQYPFVVNNGFKNYGTGSVEGIFVPSSKVCDVTAEYLTSYEMRDNRNAFLDFLCNGLFKHIKTYDGQMWKVSIDGMPKENMSEFYGTATTAFNFTEVSAPDNLVVAV